MLLTLLLLQAPGAGASLAPEEPLIQEPFGKPTVNVGGRLMLDFATFSGSGLVAMM